MGCCGNKKASASIEYEVTLADGTKTTVKTMAEVRLALLAGKGGSYKSVPVKPVS